MTTRHSVLVSGANGYIGFAVSRAFVRAGWRVYGLIRRAEAAQSLASEEIVPIVGTLSDLTFLDNLCERSKTFDVIVSCTEPADYISHYHEAVAMIRRVAQTSNDNGARPLVLWSSGCKDYGTTPAEGSPDLAPHTETSPLNAPSVLRARAQYSLRLLENTDLFDVAVLRPTNVYGYSSSYWGIMFAWAAEVIASGSKALKLGISPGTVLHAMHVDDCAEAYVALAEHPDRKAVDGQCFNISAHKYETCEVVLKALATEYGFPDGAKFIEPKEAGDSLALQMLFGYSQWVGSDKIRKLTGWKDRRMLLTENIHAYRVAYEAATKVGHDDVVRVKGRENMWRKFE